MFHAIKGGLCYTSPEGWTITIHRPHWGAEYRNYLERYLGREPAGWREVWETRPVDDILGYVDGRLCWVYGATGTDGSATLVLPVTPERLTQYIDQIPHGNPPPAVLWANGPEAGRRETLGGPIIYEAAEVVYLSSWVGREGEVVRARVVYINGPPSKLPPVQMEGVEVVYVDCKYLYPYTIERGYEHDDYIYQLDRDRHCADRFYQLGVKQIYYRALLGEDKVSVQIERQPEWMPDFLVSYGSHPASTVRCSEERLPLYQLYPKGDAPQTPPALDGHSLRHRCDCLVVYGPVSQAKSARSVLDMDLC